MSRLLVAGLSLVLLLAACSDGRMGQPEVSQHVPAVGERDDTSSSRGSVAEYFSPPVRHPGPTWTKGGLPVDGRELNSIAGPEHCDWQSAVVMHLRWPLGTASSSSAAIRQFIRDPDGGQETTSSAGREPIRSSPAARRIAAAVRARTEDTVVHLENGFFVA